MYPLDLLFYLLLPILGYLLLMFVGNLLEGRLNITGEPSNDPDSGTTGVIGVFALLLIVPGLMLALGIPKEYYWYVVAALVLFANKGLIARLLTSSRKDSHPSKPRALQQTQAHQTKTPATPQTKPIETGVPTEQVKVLNGSRLTSTTEFNAHIGPKVNKIIAADKTEKLIPRQKEVKQSPKIEVQRISAENWIYSASEKRLFNKATGEDLYTYLPLGFSIGTHEFTLHNKKDIRRILISEVQQK